ncbi:chromosomal replication initiator protein DnaA [Spiroplasma diminutum]|uniref:Chromosomal replication initiator protein DnaA n=1 Tax=Spiroplasma diminutum CUAS-1 TaxID=1276221 RepID=S5MII1_9MOLU|nr:chromosomal replication initiator protein DnaA [Spiroplasma diminutum]AGR41705.1 chromosomal replication initiation protein [Spiroplasma diminutum CUAS-1]
MTNTALWKEIKKWLISSDIIEPNIYEDYIKNDASIEDLTDNQKAIVVNKDLSKYYLENISHEIKEKISTILKLDMSISFFTKDEFKKEKKITEIIIKKNKKNNNSKEFIFNSFILGKSNSEAYNASKAVINNLGNKWNPLFIYGESGLGKTHLLKAINNELNLIDEELNVKYYASNDFRKEILDALLGGFKEIEQTKDEMNAIDVLLIDDIQFLANSGKTNEIFFNIFNSFIEEGKQIVITSDKFPEHLNGFDKRLVSRFNQGLSVKIETPDFDTAIKIIDYKTEISNLKLDIDSKRFIASHFGTDVRKIEGIINKIEFKLIQEKDSIGEIIELETIQKLLEDYSFAPGGEITVQKIKNVVAQNYGINVKSIDAKNKVSNVVLARHVSMYLTNELMKKNYSEIGILFGGKDHTTVINACNKVKKSLAEDKIFKNVLKKIKKEIVS